MTAVPPPAAATRLVLVVDDDAQVRALLARWATIAGHTAVVAVDGRDALDSFARHPGIEAVITDVRMPGIDGFALLEWIREQRPKLVARTFFITGDAGSRDMNKRLELLGVPVLRKPFKMESLLQQCQQLLAAQTAAPMSAAPPENGRLAYAAAN